MHSYIDPNQKLKFREKPYLKLQTEERSYVIQNLFRQGYLSFDDVRSYLRIATIEPFIWASAPIAFVPVAPRIARSIEQTMYRVPNQIFRLYLGVAIWTAAAVTWNYLNPATLLYKRSQTKLMDYLDYQVADYIFDYNTMLPRRWTQSWINWQTSLLYVRRRYFGSSILTPPVTIPDIIYDQETIVLNDD